MSAKLSCLGVRFELMPRRSYSSSDSSESGPSSTGRAAAEGQRSTLSAISAFRFVGLWPLLAFHLSRSSVASACSCSTAAVWLIALPSRERLQPSSTTRTPRVF